MLERNSVVAELFGAWAEGLGPGRSDVVVALFRYLTRVARDGQASFYASHDSAGRSLELLSAIAQKRPEFRSLTSGDVLQVILKRLATPGFWKGQADTLKLAGNYLTAFSGEQADQAVAAVLKLFGGLDPTKDIWPIVQPAMNILMSGVMPGLSKRNPELGRDVVMTILRFGIGQQSEHSRLLFFLEDFDLRSISDPKLTQDLEQVLQDVHARAKEINSSAAIYNICGLLYGSKVSGAHGVGAALESFKAILSSPDRHIPSITLPAAYQVLTIISSRQRQIVSDAKLDDGAFAKEMEEILGLVIGLWHRAVRKPMVFASFSLPPPTKPSSTVIHNWAYASVDFRLAIDKSSQILEVLAAAEMQPELRDAVGSGRSARLGAAEIETVTKEKSAMKVAIRSTRLLAIDFCSFELFPRTRKRIFLECSSISASRWDLMASIAASCLWHKELIQLKSLIIPSLTITVHVESKPKSQSSTFALPNASQSDQRERLIRTFVICFSAVEENGQKPKGFAKRGQQSDIDAALRRWRDYKKRKRAER